jgi:hypothetical protein
LARPKFFRSFFPPNSNCQQIFLLVPPKPARGTLDFQSDQTSGMKWTCCPRFRCGEKKIGKEEKNAFLRKKKERKKIETLIVTWK